MHEHSRPDRDEYLEMGWYPFGDRDLGKYPKSFANNISGKYDYASTMHYPMWSLPGNSRLKKQFEREEINGVMVTNIGQQEGLSRRDIEAIKALYGK